MLQILDQHLYVERIVDKNIENIHSANQYLNIRFNMVTESNHGKFLTFNNILIFNNLGDYI